MKLNSSSVSQTIYLQFTQSFVYTELNVKTVLFQTIEFSMST